MAKSTVKKTAFLANVKWGALAATAMVFLSLMPQIHLWLVRGRDWNGAYRPLQGDEFLYSAYINALIDGRPRLNDPFAGRDSTPKSPLPESTFSIQFLPPYVISSFARAFGASASTAFIVLLGVTGLLASLSVLWLLASVTSDRKLAAAGVLLVLCCGGLAGDLGLVGVVLNHERTAFMPFLRRYQPAAVFPLFFVFCSLVWRALYIESKRRARLHAICAGLTLVTLMFSYLYLWTAAAAWLGCLASMWIYLRPAVERRNNLEILAIAVAIPILAIIPYAYLVSHRGPSSDDLVTLISTRQPDLFHIPEMMGAFVLVALILGARSGKVERSEPRFIFAASFAVLPFVVFNQQVFTGRSMQPLHFDHFVANYAVLISLVIVAKLLWRPVPNRALVRIAVLCILWATIEVNVLTLLTPRFYVSDDEMIPTLLRLKELAEHDGTLSGLRFEGKSPAVVFSPEPEVMRLLPTWAPQGTLLGMGALDFGSASQKERRELLYTNLYYSVVDTGRLRELLNKRTEDSFMNFYVPSVIFGDERVFPTLSFDYKPIQPDEIEEQVRAYQAYTDSFSREKVLEHPLAYVVTRAEHASNLSNIDRWYERDVGERIGDYNLYRLKLRE